MGFKGGIGTKMTKFLSRNLYSENVSIKKLLASRRQIWYIKDRKGATAHKVVDLH